jgi:hypothetical protein
LPVMSAGVLGQVRRPAARAYAAAHFEAAEGETSWLTRLLARLRPEGWGRVYG